MRKNIVIILFIIVSGYVYPQSTLQQFINHPSLKYASVGVSVVNLENGSSIVEHNPDKSLTPASVLKLITTSVAIELLGENFRYKTEIAVDKEEPLRILILGGGDPTLGSSVFKDNPEVFFVNSVEALKNKLTDKSNKEYSIYVVDDLFGYDGVSPHWTWIDMGNYYASGTYGISVFDNSYSLFFNTANLNQCPRILRTEPEIKGLTFQNQLTLNTSGHDNGYIYGEPFSYERFIKGNIPGGRSEFSIKGDIPDPGMLVGETLAHYMKLAGYQIGNVETARIDYLARQCDNNLPAPYQADNVVFSQLSRPLKDIIREINVQSNNHYAEHLIRTIGRKANDNIYTDALDSGIEYIHSFWKQKNISTSSLHMYDGCGLAPQNAISPRLITDILEYMHNNSEHNYDFLNSLPKAGQEGTLRSFLQDSRLNGKVIAKSGSINGVQCYAGYLMDGNKKYAFAIMVNNFNDARSQVRNAIGQFLLGL